MTSITNMIAQPRLGRCEIITELTGRDPQYSNGAIYCHVHSKVLENSPTQGLRVSGKSGNNDTHIAPGGREGLHRNGMKPGMTYTASVDLILDSPLKQPLNKAHLKIVVGCTQNGVKKWRYAESRSAPNETGTHRITVSFTLPRDATDSWIRLVNGSAVGGGVVEWDNLMLVEGRRQIAFFDVQSKDCKWYEFFEVDGLAVRRRKPITQALGEFPADLSSQYSWVHDALTHASDLLEDNLEEEFHSLANELQLIVDPPLASMAFDAISNYYGNNHEVVLEITREVTSSHPTYLFLTTLRAKTYGKINGLEKQIEALKSACALSDSAELHYAYARSLEKNKQFAEAKEVVLRTAATDTNCPFDATKAASIEWRWFDVRRKLGKFVDESLSEIRKRARPLHDSQTESHKPLPEHIFTAWMQGYENSPAVVKACHSALTQNNESRNVHSLTDDNLPYYTHIPEQIIAKIGDAKAQLSDLYRLDLLSRYGGIWIDATCYSNRSLTAAVRPLVESGFFAFRYNETRISNWFLVAKPRNYIIAMMRSTLLLWWERQGYLIDYFMFHHFFEVLYWMDERFQKEWDSASFGSSLPPHELQRQMFDEINDESYYKLLNKEFVHKLKYQYANDQINPNSTISRIVRGF